MEDKFINDVASIFTISRKRLESLKDLYTQETEDTPYKILKVSPDDEINVIRRQWKKLVLENHPDKVLAKGLPKEAVKLANARLSKINLAWNKIKDTKVLEKNE